MLLGVLLLEFMPKIYVCIDHSRITARNDFVLVLQASKLAPRCLPYALDVAVRFPHEATILSTLNSALFPLRVAKNLIWAQIH